MTIGSGSERPPFEQLAVGDHIPSLVRGPLTSSHLMRWSAAIENWHRIHYDLPFAQGHDGLPGLLVNGSWKQHFLTQTVRQFAEPDGWLRDISFQFRMMDVIPTTLTAWGKIFSLQESDGFGLVHLEVGIRNEAGDESTPGTATVVIPTSAGNPVPYPYPRSHS